MKSPVIPPFLRPRHAAKRLRGAQASRGLLELQRQALQRAELRGTAVPIGASEGSDFSCEAFHRLDNVHNIYIYIPIGSMYAIYGNIYHPYIYIYIFQWIGLREHLNRKPWFWPSNWLGFPVNCPIIQFYDRYIYIYVCVNMQICKYVLHNDVAYKNICEYHDICIYLYIYIYMKISSMI